MLAFHDHSNLGRRDFLRVGSLALGGLGLSGLVHGETPIGRRLQDRSVVLLFLHGGPSQIETFDPKMSAPEGIRSATGEIKTSLPGVTFGGTFPRLAKLATRVSVVRSFVTGDGNHDIKPVLCKESFKSNLGSVCAHVRGANHPTSGLPTNIALFPKAVEPQSQAANFNFGKFDSPGVFSASCTPFMPGSGGTLQRDMELRLSRERLSDRRHLLTQFDRLRAGLDAEGVDSAREKALRVLLLGAGEAFDLSKENNKTVDRYDTGPLVRPENISRKWNNYNNYVDNARTLGRLMLLARRLCERGAGFVTVTTNFVWDMHADVNNAPMVEGMKYMAPPLDHAVSAFLEDVAARGLSEKILLVVCGEMGRTPRMNKNGGRDHWGNLAPLLLAGGGLEMGHVIGHSSRNGGDAASDPVSIRHLLGTIFSTLFDLGILRVQRGVPRELLSMAEYPSIPGLN